VALKYYKVM